MPRILPLLLATLGLLPLAHAEEDVAPATGLDFAGIDRSVRPGDDFFRYANGSWLATVEIPADRSTWGPGAEVTERTIEREAALMREAADNGAPGSNARRIGDTFAAFMDEALIERRGLAPLAADLKRIDGIRDRTELARALGETLRADVDVLNSTQLHTPNLFGLWIAQDLDDPAHYSAFLLQGGLVMPDRDYYLNPSRSMADVRTAYEQHIAALFAAAGLRDGTRRARAVYALEHDIAAVHASRADSEHVLEGDNHWPAAAFAQRAPGLDWPVFFAAAGLGAQREFVVWQPHALSGIAALTAQVPLWTWKDWLRLHLIEERAPVLPRRFVEEHFAFHERVLAGTPQLAPRWKRAVAATDAALGEAVGRLYVERYFPPGHKADVETMVANIKRAFAARIERLAWMAPATRAEAQAKLATLKVGIGYPDEWRDYSGLEVDRADAYGNAVRAGLYAYHMSLARLGRPVDRGEWVMDPQLVNAVNLPAMNAINVPAAILQPPYYDPGRDAAMNYGAIGAIIGHEISHSFDDQGALFDARGRLRNWWTPEDFAHFDAAGQRLVAQYDAYRPFPDVSVNGRLTLSENIADVGGLAAAYDAWLALKQGAPEPGAPGYSPPQLFFLAFAQSWRQTIREAELRQRLVTDGHAPAEYRADAVRNLDPWYAAFEVRPGERLYLKEPERVRIW